VCLELSRLHSRDDKDSHMTQLLASTLSKVPEVTLGFWVIKVLATTLGETGGDAVTMSMNLGYAIGSFVFIGIFAAAVIAQISAKAFHPFLYWVTIVATTTLGTTMADFADRSLGIGYFGGSSILFAGLIASMAVWRWSEGSISVNTVATPRVEMFYWVAILFSQTLGTALGDWMADTNGVGYEGVRHSRSDHCRSHPHSPATGGCASGRSRTEGVKQPIYARALIKNYVQSFWASQIKPLGGAHIKR